MNHTAKDYIIAPALFDAYIARPDKRSPNLMTDDRRPITEQEVLGLIDWYLNNHIDEANTQCVEFNSGRREGYKIRMSFIKEKEEE